MKITRQFLVWLVVLVTIVGPASLALAHPDSPEIEHPTALQTPNTLVRANGNVRLRAEPDLNSEKLSLIPWGDIAIFLGQTEDGEWYQLNHNNVIGWAVSEWFTLVSGELEPVVDANADAVPQATVIPSEPSVVSAEGAVNATGQIRSLDNVRIRQEPTIRSARIGFIGWGEVADLIAVSADGSWYQINFNGVIGWVISDPFEVIAGEELAVIAPNNEVVNSPLSVPPLGNASGLVTAQANVRIRAEPSLQSPRIAFIGWGEEATIVGINDDGTWYQINYNGIVGWSLSQFFVVEGDLTTSAIPAQNTTPDAPTATVDPNATVSPDATAVVSAPSGEVFGIVRSLGNLRLRQEPRLNARQIGRLGWGDEANLLAISDDGFWFQIEFEGVIGWAIADYFELVQGQIPVSQ